MNRVVDRSQMLNAIAADDTARAHLKADIPRLRQRFILLNHATFFCSDERDFRDFTGDGGFHERIFQH
jgi:hypothetical protein